jgi:hypothetical protein
LTGASGVVALFLLEWGAGWVAAATWTQSWFVVSRGHFKITAYCALVLAVLAVFAYGNAADAPLPRNLVIAFAVGTLLYLLVQYSRTDWPGVVVGAVVTAIGLAALVASAADLPGWPAALAGAGLVTGMGLMGAVTNGMMLGHWYLNQPGLKPWALARLTGLGIAVTAACAAAALAGAGRLTSSSTRGAVLGIPGFGDSFGVAFFAVGLGLLAFTGAIVWMARRCVRIRSIQSATGLYYVALLTAGVAEFLLLYLMVNP